MGSGDTFHLDMSEKRLQSLLSVIPLIRSHFCNKPLAREPQPLMYTPAQVSEMLDIPGSSLRRLSAELKDFLSRQQGRHRRYTESDINTLRRARELTSQGYSIARIKQELELVTEPPETPTDSLALVPTVAREIERLDASYQLILRELERITAERELDRERLAALEEYLSLPWHKRIFTKPPKP